MSAQKLQQLAETRFEIKAAKAALLERIESQLTFTYGGGLFKATPYLLAEIAGYLSIYNVDDTVVMLDEYENPIEVTLGVFRTFAMEARQYAMNSYKNDYDKLKKVRKGDKL